MDGGGKGARGGLSYTGKRSNKQMVNMTSSTSRCMAEEGGAGRLREDWEEEGGSRKRLCLEWRWETWSSQLLVGIQFF